MPTLPEVIIEAFESLDGERSIKEINNWIYKKYGNRWKDVSTTMADMVPVSHGGNGSSTIDERYRVLRRIDRGKYCLIKSTYS